MNKELVQLIDTMITKAMKILSYAQKHTRAQAHTLAHFKKEQKKNYFHQTENASIKGN